MYVNSNGNAAFAALRNHPDLRGCDNQAIIETLGEIAGVGFERDHIGKVELRFPAEQVNNDFLYGEELENLLIRNIFHGKPKNVGVIPGNFTAANKTVKFDGKLELSGTDSILVFSDSSMRGYAGINDFIHLSLGKLNMIIMPFGHLLEETRRTKNPTEIVERANAALERALA